MGSFGMSQRGLGGRCQANSAWLSGPSALSNLFLLSIMPPAQEVDSEHLQTVLNSLSPSGRGTEIIESHGSLSQLRVDVTVLRAHNIPDIKRKFSRKRQFFVTVTNLVTTKKTERVQIDGETVLWNQRLSAFFPQRSSHLIICLYEKRLIRRDVVIGTQEIPIPVVSQSDIPFLLGNGDGNARPSTHPVALYLTITVSANIFFPIVPSDTPEIPTEGGGPPAEESTKPSIISDSGELIQPTTPEPLSPSSGPIPVEAGTLVPDGQAEMSPQATEEALFALRRADEAKKPIDRKNTWKGAVRRIKWVMDTLSSIAELHPFAKMAYGLVSALPETLLEQYQRDDNVLILLEAMHDAFDFAHHEDTLKSIKPDSKQAQILTLMLQDVCTCSDFIQSYTKDSQFWKRTFKNLSGGATKEIEDLSAAFAVHRRAFLDQATITTEITAFQILDGVGIISAKVDGISTRLEWVSSQVADADVDAKIREIPYGTGSRFTPDKGCLTGTRTGFLDFIVNWVNDPTSERGLVLFGQAGTGKSSIAHEIARRFDKMHRLTSSFIFLRKEQTKREAYHLFTTLARDLSDRYPSFKTALGRIVKDNSSLRVGTRDCCTLFQSLILEPLDDLHIVGPILVVIDGLDESGDTAIEFPCAHHLAAGGRYRICVHRSSVSPHKIHG
ncbi:hypothetical protein EDB92DRAFT_779548 [Lactarius akahatsu]|uniref:C2 domain-containing protein n=1 Tax=Lactarius akahatsu TaxID=416441 RepID=A0AAD4QCW2_9AGAM|nr:hypothetical protein EDB92DRAFT_779548 [Lactarius akahatsu]